MNASTLQLLVDAAQNRQLTLFIGADLPEEITGLPSSATLAAELSTRFRTHVPKDPHSLLRVVEAIGPINYGDVISYLIGRLDSCSIVPGELDMLAAQLSANNFVGNYITTRYDDLLEKAFREQGTQINRVVTRSDIPYTRGNRATLLKLSGDLQQPESLILTQGQLFTLPERIASVGNLATTMMRQIVLFLGFDLESPYFFVLRTIILLKLIEFGELTPFSYLVPTTRVSKTDVRVWQGRSIRIIEDDPVSVLRALAKELGIPPYSPQSFPTSR